jgi:2-polyprenyl-3-methyl-5-hydroxy-6-metoxy-1,4-benzoquinol methylase
VETSISASILGVTHQCEACGSQEVSSLLTDLSHVYLCDGRSKVWSYQLLECQTCHLGFVDPEPDWELLQSFYPPEYGCYDFTDGLPEREAESLKYRTANMRMAAFQSKSTGAVVRSCLGTLVEWLTGRKVSSSLGVPLQLPKEAQIFELGYGSGMWLLSMAHLGYCNLHGYDITANSNNVRRLLEKGISISTGLFLDNEYPSGAFDCIRLEHVFEHLLYPRKVLEQCSRMLKPGGLLVMNTPCRDSWSAWLSLEHFAALDLPRHLYHHTPRSATALIERSGLRVVDIRPYSVARVLAKTINNLLLSKNRKALTPYLFDVMAPMYRLLAGMTHKGEHMSVCAVKPA